MMIGRNDAIDPSCPLPHTAVWHNTCYDRPVVTNTNGRQLFTGILSLLLVYVAAFGATAPPSIAVSVRQAEGELHGFLVLRTLEGVNIADGELTQKTHGSQVTSRLTFHFKDGSVQDETTVFSQRGHFRVLTDHLVQRGSTFKHPIDMSINASTGMVTVHYQDDHGNEKIESAHMEIPPDLGNGIVQILLKNLGGDQPTLTVPMVVATPKPLLVKLAISAEGEDPFTTGGVARKATRYVVKVNIGGVKGVVAPLVGKQPQDLHVWMLRGECPSVVKTEGPLYEGGPIWRTELVSPAWPKGAVETTGRKK